MNAPTPWGFLVLDKPAGLTSARALDAVKCRLPRRTKVGHAGTLDPFATGVLVVLVGRCTKRSAEVMALGKAYDATLRLGATTPTLDPDSAPVPDPDTRPVDVSELVKAADAFRGTVLQAPPAFSAVKVGGRRAYDLSRRGHAPELPPRPVTVDELRVTDYAWPDAHLSMRVGKGFYVRSLARDLAAAVGTTGYLTSLRRTAVGPFGARDATPADALPDDLSPLLLPPGVLAGS